MSSYKTMFKLAEVDEVGSFLVHPGNPYKEAIIRSAIVDADIDIGEMGLLVDRFIIAEAYVRKFTPVSDVEYSAIDEYFKSRGGKNIADRFELFAMLAEGRDIDALYDAYITTRRADIQEEEVPDPERTDLTNDEINAIEGKE